MQLLDQFFLEQKKKYQMNVFGIKNGTTGLLQRPLDYVELNRETFSGYLLKQGGTFLGTTNKASSANYTNEAGEKIEHTQLIIDGYHKLGLEGLIIIGGDGSMQILQNIAKKGNLNIVAIPKTIDNDVGATDSSIGFDTAVHVATQALDNLHSTAVSHSRSMILEVMGRDAGHIALSSGIAGGADIILMPEIKYSLKGIFNKLNEMKKKDLKHSLIVVAEAVKKENGEKVIHEFKDGQKRLGGIGEYISNEIMSKTDIECRVTALGHVQRGAPPTHNDRILASAFGVYAVDLLKQKKFDRMVAWKDRKVVDVPITNAISTYKNVERNDALVETALSLGIYIGDIN